MSRYRRPIEGIFHGKDPKGYQNMRVEQGMLNYKAAFHEQFFCHLRHQFDAEDELARLGLHSDDRGYDRTGLKGYEALSGEVKDYLYQNLCRGSENSARSGLIDNLEFAIKGMLSSAEMKEQRIPHSIVSLADAYLRKDISKVEYKKHAEELVHAMMESSLVSQDAMSTKHKHQLLSDEILRVPAVMQKNNPERYGQFHVKTDELTAGRAKAS